MLITLKRATHILAKEGLHEVTEAEALRLFQMGIAEKAPEKKPAARKKKKAEE